MRRQLGFAILAFLFAAASGCKESDPTQPDVSVVEAVLTHFGFDFSAGIVDTVEFNNNDGETIYWMPGNSTNPSYPGNASHIWYRTGRDYAVNETKDMGIVDLASVTAVPEAWDASPLIPPLLVDHVIVARCRDGYVKFKVLSTDTTGLWPAKVQYLFSATSSFPQ